MFKGEREGGQGKGLVFRNEIENVAPRELGSLARDRAFVALESVGTMARQKAAVQLWSV